MRAHLFSALAMTFVLALPAGSAHAQQPDPVRVHLDKGATLYKDGAYDAALIEFQRAYELSKNYKILYNVGLVSVFTKDYAAALKAFRTYLEKGGKEIAAARRAEVEKEVVRLQGLVGNLEISGTADAEVQVDDVVVGKLPLSSEVLLNPGRHKVAISKEGKEPTVKSVILAAGERTRLDIQLADKPVENKAPPPPVAPIVTAAPPPPPPPKVVSSTPAWPFWVVTGALAAGTATMGALTLSKYGSLKDERDSRKATTESLDSLSSSTKAFAITADVLGGLTIASTAVAIYFSARKGSSETPAAPAQTARVQLGAGSFALVGSF